ncbi:hypothetical protein SKAU_G00002470 [Synaphobranchus kaupii]|uniref:Uncharacterized protein n=1 Tax=Synaphobranchus kaupii TaxID=118154 RepID=A0A9Q1JCP2_SYNKA|nr:hypothetical protein SKAU_G00002470 [Synaphobranchus kaupii]
MCWYVLEKHLCCLTKHSHQRKEFRGDSMLIDAERKLNAESFSHLKQDMEEDPCDGRLRPERRDRASPDVPCSPSANAATAPCPLRQAHAGSPGPAVPLLECPKTPSGSPVSEPSGKWAHLTELELKGLKALVEKLESLPENKKSVPEGLEHPQALLEDMKVALKEHGEDDTKLDLAGVPVVCWPKKPAKVGGIAHREVTCFCSHVTFVDFRICNRVTDQSLIYFKRCGSICHIDLRYCKQVSKEGCEQFIAEMSVSVQFGLIEEKLLQKLS